jgi:hypothetical protein
MTGDEGVVRFVSWRDICAWTVLFRLFRLSVSVQVLLLALTGALVTSLGWRVAVGMLSNDPTLDPAVRGAMAWHAMAGHAMAGQAMAGTVTGHGCIT